MTSKKEAQPCAAGWSSFLSATVLASGAAEWQTQSRPASSARAELFVENKTPCEEDSATRHASHTNWAILVGKRSNFPAMAAPTMVPRRAFISELAGRARGSKLFKVAFGVNLYRNGRGCEELSSKKKMLRDS